MMEFEKFDKIARLNRDIIITEKIDGTNAQIAFDDDMNMFVGSRNRWLSEGNDNFGFYIWALMHEYELKELGPGRHYGEWWGLGIQRGYGVEQKRFSLFNVSRWGDVALPDCIDVVPKLYEGAFDESTIIASLDILEADGSRASPGFMDAEGIVIYHTAAREVFKVTIKNDEKPKGSRE